MNDASHMAHAPELEELEYIYYDMRKFCGGKNCMFPPKVKTPRFHRAVWENMGPSWDPIPKFPLKTLNFHFQ